MENEESFEERFKKYTLKGLIDIRDHIDKEKYPDRYKAVLNQISEKNLNPPMKDETANQYDHAGR